MAPAAGRPDASVVGSVAALRRPRWRLTRLPDAGRGGLAAYGIRSAYLGEARLWGAIDGVAYWLVPVVGLDANGCPGGGAGQGVCAVAVRGRRALGALCATPDQARSAVRATLAGGAVFGFAPGDGGRVELEWAGAGSFVPVDGGFWVEPAPAGRGAPDRLAYDPSGPPLHAEAPIVVLSAGAPAATVACVARRLAAHPDVSPLPADSSVVDLGRATSARRASSFVMTDPTTPAHAHRVARALGIRSVRRFSGGYRRLLGRVAIIAVVLGTRARC